MSQEFMRKKRDLHLWKQWTNATNLVAVVLFREVSERRDGVVVGGRDCIDTAQMVAHELVVHRRD